MRKIGIYEQWKAVKQKIVAEVARVKELYKKDCDELKIHGSKPRTTDPKYSVMGLTVKLSLHFLIIHFESFAVRFTVVIQNIYLMYYITLIILNYITFNYIILYRELH